MGNRKASIRAEINLMRSDVGELKNAWAFLQGEWKAVKAMIYGLYVPAFLGLLGACWEIFHGR